MSDGLVRILKKSDNKLILTAVHGTMVMKLKNFGPYKTVAGAKRGQKEAAKLFGLEIDENIEETKALKARRNSMGISSDFISKLRDITRQETDPQVAYFRLKREFEADNISDDVINCATDGIVYRDAMMVDVQETVNKGDLMNAKYKMEEVTNFTDLWYHVDGYENYQTLTMDDVNMVIDQIEQEVNN